MSVPRVVRGPQKAPFDDGAPAFWRAARLIDSSVLTRGFSGDLQGLGFVEDRSDTVMASLRAAMIPLHEVLPDLQMPAWTPSAPRQERDIRLMELHEQHDAILFWYHPEEQTLAITKPYSFGHPVGSASATLFHFGALDDKSDQNKRNTLLGALNAANQERSNLVSLLREDAYKAKGSGFGQTFAFAKHRTFGGRDQETRTARGFSLSKDHGTRLINAEGAPYLFLEITYEEVSV